MDWRPQVTGEASFERPLTAQVDQIPATGDINFNVGDKFSTFAELEEKISRYSAANYVQLWKRDARTIQAAKKRVGKIAAGMPDELVYQSVKFCCIQGGKKFTTKATERSYSVSVLLHLSLRAHEKFLWRKETLTTMLLHQLLKMIYQKLLMLLLA
ncbi:hypothetical protein MTO96_004564 [Rhipicephalus appendiculatus]